MRLHFIVHEDFEAPGAYEIWAQNNDFKITYSRVYLNEALPSSAEDIDFLIVMGWSTRSRYDTRDVPSL